jgi:hypothetical protein
LHLFKKASFTTPPRIKIQIKNIVIGPFFFEEPMVTGDTILFKMENALCHVPLGTVFQLHNAPPHFSLHVRKFSGQGSLDRERGPIPGPLVLEI